jgi:long-chain acyl-CoA synthetase
LVNGVIRATQKYFSRTIPKINFEHVRFADALALGAKQVSPEKLRAYVSAIDSSTVAALQYTGGTTGVSKGAMLSHGNLATNTLQLIAMCGDYMRPGKEIVITALPLYHIFAFTINLLGFWHIGGRNLLVPSPRPPSNLKRVFENYRVTWMTGVNTLFNALLNERWFTDSPPKHLRASAAGGMALHESVSERWRKLTGTPIVEGYGLTESSPVLTFNPLGGQGKDGTIGIPVPSTLVKCVKDNGTEAAEGEPGEIYASGPQIMLGYWQRPAETKEAISGGWLKTGDIATRDSDGYFTIVDRKKDMILVSGFNVFPNEVEEQIASLDGVLEVGVIGVPSSDSGERVKAFVVTGSKKVTEAEVIAHCRLALAAYKVPSSVEFVSELPKSPIGKILRKDLRAQWVEKGSIAGSEELKG